MWNVFFYSRERKTTNQEHVLKFHSVTLFPEIVCNKPSWKSQKTPKALCDESWAAIREFVKSEKGCHWCDLTGYVLKVCMRQLVSPCLVPIQTFYFRWQIHDSMAKVLLKNYNFNIHTKMTNYCQLLSTANKRMRLSNGGSVYQICLTQFSAKNSLTL